MRSGLLLVAALGACYEPPQTDEACTITCTEGAADACPGDLVCEGGYCVGPGQVCRPTFVRVTAGTGFGCAIDDGGALWCWGRLTGTHRAVRVDNANHWDSIDAGGDQICGISNEQLFCWGDNDETAPIEIVAAGVGRWSQVSAGSDYTCAVGDGQLLCWGKNDAGQLGDGSTTDRTAPTPVSAQIVDWTAVAAGERHTCAISTTFGVHCFGANQHGELGQPAGSASMIPVAVTMGGSPLLATSVAVGTFASCAVAADGVPYCWGYNASGQLGDRRLVDPTTVTETAQPTKASDVAGFTKIAGAQAQFCGLAGDAVYCWGEAVNGGIGAGIWNDARVFQKTITAGATDISVGEPINEITGYNDLDLGCAIVGGDAQCWGDNRYGQLGVGGRTLAIEPLEVAGGHRFKDLSAGSQHVCGIGDDMTLYCWGSTERGQTTGFIYGGGSPRMACAQNPSDPSQPLCDVGAPRALTFSPNPVAVATGTAHTCALSNGVVSCWGTGLGTTALKRDLPQPAGAMWKTLLHTGRDSQCGIAAMANDPVWCIGQFFGAATMPARVARLDGFKAIAVGGPTQNDPFAVYLDATGMLQGEGDNSLYQMGDTTNVDYATTMAVPNRTYAYTAISTRANDTTRGDANFVCSIREDNQTVECWGQASRGQTGAADVSMATMAPNAVPNLGTCTAVATGVEHACAICSGSVYCWGDNRSGQLAMPPSDLETPIPRLVDLPVNAGDAWVQLVAGSRFTCVRSQSGRAYCWGLSEHGALGNGATGSNLPVTVLAAQVD